MNREGGTNAAAHSASPEGCPGKPAADSPSPLKAAPPRSHSHHSPPAHSPENTHPPRHPPPSRTLATAAAAAAASMHPLAASLAALLALLAAGGAWCAPAGAPPLDACAAVRNSSLMLSRRAGHVFSECDRAFRNRSNDDFVFGTPPEWIVGKGVCDPGTLKHKSAPCMEKIFRVLSSYKSALRRISAFSGCAAYVAGVTAEVEALQGDMGRCLSSKGLSLQVHEEGPWATAAPDLQCHYTLDRLHSFSILAARVFAEGDPARHAEAAAQKCA